MFFYRRIVIFLTVLCLISCNDQQEKPNALLSDQSLPHESGPHGVNPEEEWAQRPLILQGITVPEYDTLGRKEPFKAIIAWGQVYEAIEGNPAKDVRVQLKNLKTYLFSKSTGKWELVNSTEIGKINGAFYRENWEDNYNTKPDVREEDEGISVKVGNQFVYHFYPEERKIIIPEDFGGIFVTVEARLISGDSKSNDAIEEARYLVNVGADFWKDQDAPWAGHGINNKEIAFGRFKYARKEWQSYNMICLWESRHEVTDKDLFFIRGHNPPLN